MWLAETARSPDALTHDEKKPMTMCHPRCAGSALSRLFEGRCEEALAFYRWRALGAEVTMLMRFRESRMLAWSRRAHGGQSDACELPGIGDTTVLASDGFDAKARRAVRAVRARADGAERGRGGAARSGALGDGGQVQMPMTKTFFSRAGMVGDRFGVSGWSTTP